MQIEDTRAFGQAIRVARRNRRMTQRELALVAGTGERFVVDLESGKPTTQIGRALMVLAALGLRLELVDPQRNDDDDAP